jgi:hypothetical protein
VLEAVRNRGGLRTDGPAEQVAALVLGVFTVARQACAGRRGRTTARHRMDGMSPPPPKPRGPVAPVPRRRTSFSSAHQFLGGAPVPRWRTSSSSAHQFVVGAPVSRWRTSSSSAHRLQRVRGRVRGAGSTKGCGKAPRALAGVVAPVRAAHRCGRCTSSSAVHRYVGDVPCEPGEPVGPRRTRIGSGRRAAGRRAGCRREVFQ